MLLPTPKDNKQLNKELLTEKSNSFRIKDAVWFDGINWNKHDLVVVNGKIVDNSADIQDDLLTVSYNDKFIIPGLIDAHTHTWGNALKDALSFGVTTELDMFTQPEVLSSVKSQRHESVKTDQADLFSAGVLATSPGGHGTEYGFDIPTIDHPDAAESFVKARIAEGSDYIKIVYHHKTKYGPYTSIDFATLKALIDAAKKYNKLAVVHISDYQSAKEAVQAGADGLVHSFGDKEVDESLIAQMKAKRVFIIPTLTMLSSLSGIKNNSFIVEESTLSTVVSKSQINQLTQTIDASFQNNDALEIAKENVAKMHSAGIKILAGTDAPNPGAAHGISLHQELILLTESGLSPNEALISATYAAHSAFGLKNRGHLKPGAKADFLILNEDPRIKISNTQSLSLIYKNGYAKKLEVKKNISTPIQGTLAEFTKDLSTKTKIPLFATSDKMAKGNSVAKVSWSNKGCNQSGSAKVSGEIKSGFPFPWAGAMVVFSSDMSKTFDFKNNTSLDFEFGGEAGNYRLFIFVKGIQRPKEIPFELPNTSINNCKAISINLKDYDNIDWSSVTGIAWVVNPNRGKFDFYLDDIVLR